MEIYTTKVLGLDVQYWAYSAIICTLSEDWETKAWTREKSEDRVNIINQD